jgi:hypothetical protein
MVRTSLHGLRRHARSEAVLLVCGLLVATLSGVVMMNMAGASSMSGPSSASPYPAGSPAEFAYLSHQTSNACGLQTRTVLGYSDSVRLQGSCCNPMDMAKYQAQVQGLHRYATIDAIVPDPYDVPVALAKRLLGYEHSIRLTRAERATFSRAMNMTADKGPCCCHCWRWHTTTGLAKYLIADQRFSAAEVASVTDLVNGCGGPPDHGT